MRVRSLPRPSTRPQGDHVMSKAVEREPCPPECDGERHECYACGGEGLVLDDCFEDSCPCADPETDHDIVECEVCRGAGGWPCPATLPRSAR